MYVFSQIYSFTWLLVVSKEKFKPTVVLKQVLPRHGGDMGMLVCIKKTLSNSSKSMDHRMLYDVVVGYILAQ